MILNPSQAGRVAAALLDTASGEPELTEPRLAMTLDGRRFGNYTVARLVGIGGMGAVYEARQERTGRRVAVKIVRGEFITAEIARRFEHEARILARLQHPGIAQIFEAGSVDSPTGPTPYFAMEFVEGKPLTMYAAERQLDTRSRLELFLKVCEAVEHAHQKGVIHRDLKPGNILVTAEGQPRILDFGVARATDGDVQTTTLHTDIGQVIGTLAYMSPEQAAGDSAGVDTRSDVYALGVVLYELLAGKPPLELTRGRIHEAARIIREQEPAKLSTIDRALRGDLEVIAGKALEKERERRYQSVGELAGDVRRYLNSEPVLARPASLRYQIAKLARRHKPIVWSLLAAVVTVLLSIGVVAKFALTEASARRESELKAQEAQHQQAIASESRAFLETLIVAVAPRRFGREAKVVDVLRESVRMLDAEPPSDPISEAVVRSAVGYGLQQLGDFELAEGQLRRADALMAQILDPRGDDRLSVRKYLAHTLLDLGNRTEAEMILRDIVAIREARDGPTETATVLALNDLGECLLEMAKFGEAEGTLREALRRHAPKDDADTQTIRHNLAAVLMRLGKFTEAEPIIRAVSERDLKDFGPSHPDYLASRELLAGVLLESGHPADAEITLCEILPLKQQVYGESHLEVFKTRTTIAGAKFEQGNLSGAELLLVDLLEDVRAKLGAAHIQVVDISLFLAKVYGKNNRAADAEKLLSILIADLGTGTDQTLLTALCRLARADYLSRLSRDAEAIDQGELALAALRQISTQEHRRREAVELLLKLHKRSGNDQRVAELRQEFPDADLDPQ